MLRSVFILLLAALLACGGADDSETTPSAGETSAGGTNGEELEGGTCGEVPEGTEPPCASSSGQAAESTEAPSEDAGAAPEGRAGEGAASEAGETTDGEQSLAAAMQITCHDAIEAAESATHASERAALVARHIQEHVTHPRVIAFFEEAATLSPDARQARMNALVEEAGLESCPLAER